MAVICSKESRVELAEPRPYQRREDRIQRIIGTARRCLPAVTPESLRRYGDYLRRHLQFPFPARYHQETGASKGSARHVVVTGLSDPPPDTASCRLGLLCEPGTSQGDIVPLADLELDEGHVNAPLIDDYWYWLWNWQPVAQ